MGRFVSLVTGGAGFIGSHLVERLLAMGHEVRVIDNLASAQPRNIDLFREHQNYRFLHADINDGDKIAPAFEGVDWVFHLAAMADIVPSIQNPHIYHRSNVDGTYAVLEHVRQNGCKRFVYAASSSCYGIPDVFPTPEDAPIRPMYPYALTKYLGEQYVLHWAQTYNVPALSLRFFNVYGPRARTTGAYGAVFGVFLAQKLNNQPFTIVGDGSQTRDFTFVTDVADAVIAAAQSDITNDVFNVGSGNTYSVKSLVEMLEGPYIHIPKRPGEPDCTFADTHKITTRLNWKPKVPLAEGVRIMLNHIDDWRDAPVWTPERIAEATKDWFKYLGQN